MPFLELTGEEFIYDWDGLRTAVLMASSPEPEPSKDKGKAISSPMVKLKVPLLAIPPPSSDGDDDDDDDGIPEPVKPRTTITPLHPIAPSSLQMSTGPSKKGA